MLSSKFVTNIQPSYYRLANTTDKIQIIKYEKLNTIKIIVNNKLCNILIKLSIDN